MKLKVFYYFNLLVLMLLLNTSVLATIEEFDQLFNLETKEQSLILSKKPGVSLPDSDLNPAQRLYRYMGLFNQLELYLSDGGSTLVIVPYNRINLFYSTAVRIKLLYQADGKHFMFTNATTPQATIKQSCTSDNNSAIQVNIEHYLVPLKTFLANDTTIKYLIDQLEYGMLDLPSQIFFAKLLQPAYTSDYLINIEAEHNLPCLFKNYGNRCSKYYLLTTLVASDLAYYLQTTYSNIKERIKKYQACRQKQNRLCVKTIITTEQAEPATDLLEIIDP